MSGTDPAPRRSTAIPLVATIAALTFAATLAFGSLRPERQRLEGMRQERHEREAELVRIRAEADALEVRAREIEDDPYQIEIAIRNQYGWVRDGERVVADPDGR